MTDSMKKIIERTDRLNTLEQNTNISISMVGMGGGLSGPEWRNNNALVREGTAKIMIDIGMTNADIAQQVMPDHIIITHMHPDHVGGLARHLLWCKYVAKMRPTLYIPKGFTATVYNRDEDRSWELNSLWSNYLQVQLADGSAPDGSAVRLKLEDFADVVVCPVRIGLTGDHSYDTIKIDAGEGRKVTFEFYQIVENAHHTPHSPACGLIISNHSKKPPAWVIYTSDVRWHGGANITEEIARNANTIFHDVQIMGAPSPAGVHAHIDELLESDVDLSRVVIMHHGFEPALKFATLREEMSRIHESKTNNSHYNPPAKYRNQAMEKALGKVYALIVRGASVVCGDGHLMNYDVIIVEQYMHKDFGIPTLPPSQT